MFSKLRSRRIVNIPSESCRERPEQLSGLFLKGVRYRYRADSCSSEQRFHFAFNRVYADLANQAVLISSLPSIAKKNNIEQCKSWTEFGI